MKFYKNLVFAIRTLAIVAIFLSAGCKDSVHENRLPDFQATSFKGKIVDFTTINAGSVYLSKSSREKILSLNNDGSIKYLTADVVDEFYNSTTLSIEDGKGFCIRFQVPEIENGDYVIIDAKISFPEKISLNEKKIDSFTGSFRYTSKNSEEIEYIWFVFEDSAKKFFIKGDWSIELYSSDTVLLSQKFEAL